MIAFWLTSGVLAALALVFVLHSVLKRAGERGARSSGAVSRGALNLSVHRDQLREMEADLASGALAKEDYERARRELERRLLEEVGEPATVPARGVDRGGMIFLGVAIPVLASAIYLTVGNPGTLDEQRADSHASTAVTPQQVEAMVERLAARLKENPDDGEGWRLLGRSYSALGRFPEAADAYAKAAVRAPRDAQLLADFADALAMARSRRLEGEPEKLVLRALEIDPANLKALALAGSAAFERKDFPAAAAYWARMLPLVPPDSEDARTIRANVEEARALAEKKTSSKKLQGVVKLEPQLAGKAAPEDTVFIFARAAGGPSMPLAVLRKKVRELPVAFALDDSMAMAAGTMLSGYPRVVVGARISKSGSATPQPGDLQGSSAAVANDASGVTVLIDTVIH